MCIGDWFLATLVEAEAQELEDDARQAKNVPPSNMRLITRTPVHQVKPQLSTPVYQFCRSRYGTTRFTHETRREF